VFVELSRNAALLRAQTQALSEHAGVLQKAEQKFRSLLEAAPDPMIICRAEGEILLVNSCAEAVFGAERRQIVGNRIQRLLPDWSYQTPPIRDQSGLARPGCGAERECVAVRMNGEPFPAETTTSLLQADEGVLVTTAIRDITERKRAERQMIELRGHRELAHALDVTHTIIRDLSGAIRVWTRGAEELYGWTAKEAVGAISDELLRTEFAEPVEEIHETLRINGQREGELKHRSKDGRDIAVASHWVLHPDDASAMPAVIEVDSDITGRKVAEAALLESEERFRKVFEESPIGKIFYRPGEDRYVRVNRAFAQMLGYEGQEFGHLTVAQVSHPEVPALGLTMPGEYFRENYRALTSRSGTLPRTAESFGLASTLP